MRRCVPLLVSYCCHIPDVKYISAVPHGVMVKWTWARCMVAGADIISGEMVDEISRKKTETMRSHVLQVPRKMPGPSGMEMR